MVSACIGLSSFCPELGCGAAIVVLCSPVLMLYLPLYSAPTHAHILLTQENFLGYFERNWIDVNFVYVHHFWAAWMLIIICLEAELCVTARVRATVDHCTTDKRFPWKSSQFAIKLSWESPQRLVYNKKKFDIMNSAIVGTYNLCN